MPLRNVQLGTDAVLTHPELVNLCGCSIGDGKNIDSFVEIRKDGHVAGRRRISSHTFIREGVTIEDETFVAHGAPIESNSTVICGSTVERVALIGAGAVATTDVPDYAIVAGVPAKAVGDVRRQGFPTTTTGTTAP